jgi:hypothetical protein
MGVTIGTISNAAWVTAAEFGAIEVGGTTLANIGTQLVISGALQALSYYLTKPSDYDPTAQKKVTQQAIPERVKFYGCIGQGGAPATPFAQ